VTEAKGRPLRREVTPGQASDSGQAETLLSGIDIEAVAADKAYDREGPG
jgi:hypothetical protein